MTNVVKILRSTTPGAVPSSLVSGQIAINEADGKIFWRDATSGTVYSATINGLDATLAAKVSQTGANGAANLPAGTTAQRPTGAAGQLRYNSTTGKFEGFGSAWGNIGGGASISDTPPSNPGAGDLWWNSADGILYVYYNDGNTSQWVATDAGGEGQYVSLTDVGTVITAMLANASVTQAKLAANVAGNGPAFSAYRNLNQSISSSTWTKVQFDTEEFDTNSNYDNATNFRFTPTVAGYYQVIVNLSVAPSGNINSSMAAIYKNGSKFKSSQQLVTSNGSNWAAVTALMYLNGSTDYIEGYVYGTTSPIVAGSSTDTFFQAFLTRAA